MTEGVEPEFKCEVEASTQPVDAHAMARELQIVNQKGLHARASAKFVQTVERFDAVVKVTRCGETVGGNSIMGLMMLAAGSGTSIVVEASGNDAVSVLDALQELIDSRFGEDA
jgi:phosphocarrier protein HPr